MRFAGKRLAMAAVLPLFVLATACSDDGDAEKPSDAKSGGSDAKKPSGAGKTLTRDQLLAALLTSADMPGYQIEAGDTRDDSTTAETADRPECQPLLNLVAGDKAHQPAAYATLSAVKEGGAAEFPDANMVALGQFEGDKATQYLKEAKAALPKCAAFSSVDDKGEKTQYAAKEGAKLGFGDDSLVVDYGMDGESGGTVVKFVRSGTVLMQAMVLGSGEVPDDLLRSQYEKLDKARQG